MRKLDLLVFDTAVDRVTEGIIEAGLLHPVEVCELEPWADRLEPERAQEAIAWRMALLSRTQDLMTKMGAAPSPPPDGAGETVEKEAEEKFLGETENRFRPLWLDREAKTEELATQEKMLSEVKTFALDRIGFPIKGKYSFLELELGQVAETNLPILESGLRDVPHVLLPVQTVDRTVTLIAIVLRKDRAVLEKSLEESNFVRARMPPGKPELDRELQGKIAARIGGLTDDIAALDRRIAQGKASVAPRLQSLRRRLEIERMIQRAKTYFRKTRRTYLISGWVPEKKLDGLVKRVGDLTEGKCYAETEDPDRMEGVRRGEIQVPFAFSNPAFLKPFELLIQEYGTPEYRAIDPTPFLAITFLIMFGAMFGDLGHGFLIALLGIFLFRKPKIRKGATLLLYCGLSSMVFGFLFGSVFGYEDIFPPLWLKPMHSVTTLMQMAVLFGVIVITIGIVLNIVNALRSRRFIDILFDKAGLVGALFYWGAVGIAIKVLLVRSPTPLPVMIGILGLPILLLFLKAPLGKALGKRGKMFPEGVASYIFETLVEVIELVTGYVANTISFIRVAAFALAHLGLFLALFSLIAAVRSVPGSGLWIGL
ncbi:MAG: hypothetical protein NTV79_05595, partial [Candidatus Aureabacteria bacterium]|nr:hypothetical protein [Candidatus Auribacterota bacterium]